MSEFNINEDAHSGGEFSGSQSSNTEADSQPIAESAFPDEDEETITMMDVIEREDKLEEEASAVLGNSDEKNCTYPKGYVSRQALYSCATCYKESGKMAVLCLACSLECHDNHDLYELYTKRNYRCDCGNSLFKDGFECKLIDKQLKKPPTNENNKYNHNFFGKYCTCDKRYPPDEDDNSSEANDEMYQCLVCEDWYHGKHLGVEEMPSKFDEMICKGCVEKLDFIHYYRDCEKINDLSQDSSVAKESSETKDTKECVPIDKEEQLNNPEAKLETSPADGTPLDGATSNDLQRKPELPETQNSSTSADLKPSVNESDTNDSQVENKDPSFSNCLSDQKAGTSQPPKDSDNNECILKKLKETSLIQTKEDLAESQPDSDSKSSSSIDQSTIFWNECSWREKLCKCQDCLAMYKSKECEYLLDLKDTVQYYEAQGKVLAKNRATPLERGMNALGTIGNRAAVVEALHGYDELKANLYPYLRKLADTKQVVRESDILEFFDQLKSKKRPRLEYE